ncbi:Anthranilate phosphoribosyltransferase [Persephonella hydrogeniphila]|uniref:Anthranilate phosphoribosyltransferase n=1 Tax=Persephonella hydrogeniphila TaxID=198703 RepID=A0A285NPI7_9AQUI|nr:hypothetical protein [Persephonella hydrogeniphila]SNZ11444.1 Anthranilate phosphoribosyltransferase [Persephonella hydrogeniphila]
MGSRFLKRIKRENKKFNSGVAGVIRNILEGNYSDIKTAGALVCLKQHKSPKSYRKALEVLDEFKRINKAVKDSIEVAYPYRRKSFSPYFLISAGIVLSLLPDSKIKVVFHGENAPTAATKDIFDYLNLSPISTEDSFSMLENLNISFFNRKIFLPEVSSITHIRVDLNINDIFCHIERYINPVGSEFSVGGIRSKRELDFYTQLLKGRYKRFALIEDREGFPDIVGSTAVHIYGDREEVQEVDISKFGGKPFLYRKLDLSSHIEFINNLLSKKLPEYEPLLHINSSVLLYLKGEVSSLQEGFELSKELFDRYNYEQILRNLQRYTDYLNYKNIYEL